MARVTAEELKEFNDNTQILLRLSYMLREHLEPKINSALFRAKRNEIEDVYTDMKHHAQRLLLTRVDCSCRGNNPILTHGWIPEERGFDFECAQCGRLYIYSPISAQIERVVYDTEPRGNVSLVTSKSSWIQSIEGTWNRANLRVEDVVINRGQDNEIRYDFIPIDVWQMWSSAPSKGHFFHKHIRYSKERGWGQLMN